MDEKLVVKNAIYDRKILDAHEEEFTEFCEQLKQMTEVYDNTVQRYKERYEALLEKKILKHDRRGRRGIKKGI